MLKTRELDAKQTALSSAAPLSISSVFWIWIYPTLCVRIDLFEWHLFCNDEHDNSDRKKEYTTLIATWLYLAPQQAVQGYHNGHRRQGFEMSAVKSGWIYLHQEGIVTKSSWKLRYLVLYDDDHLVIYGKPRHRPKPPLLTINIRKHCKKILAGHQCYKWNAMQFPKGVSDIEALFLVETKFQQNKRNYIFAAFDATQRREWENVLQRSQERATLHDIFEEDILRRNSDGEKS